MRELRGMLMKALIVELAINVNEFCCAICQHCPHALLPAESTTDVYNGIWVTLYIVSSLYSFWWDVRQDWGLGDRKHAFLSDRRMHSRYRTIKTLL